MLVEIGKKLINLTELKDIAQAFVDDVAGIATIESIEIFSDEIAQFDRAEFLVVLENYRGLTDNKILYVDDGREHMLSVEEFCDRIS